MSTGIKFRKRPSLSPKRGQAPFVDLRKQLNDLFYGTPGIPAMSFEVIVRNVDKTQRCPCWDYLKQEVDSSCARCKGKGWLVYDKIYRTIKRKYIGKEYLDPVGMYEVDSTLFFFEHTTPLSEEGTIIEAVTDDEGNIIKSPVKYVKTHSIKDIEVLKGNSGRAEFSQVFASKAE